MKSSELIRRLRELDPTGDVEVCVGNEDIYFAERLPAYYDGCLQTLTHDDSKRPYWSIVGMKFHEHGDKIDLRPMGIRDVLLDDDDGKMVFDYSALSPGRAERYQAAVKRAQDEMAAIRSNADAGKID